MQVIWRKGGGETGGKDAERGTGFRLPGRRLPSKGGPRLKSDSEGERTGRFQSHDEPKGSP